MNSLDNFYIWVYYACSFNIEDEKNKLRREEGKKSVSHVVAKYMQEMDPSVVKCPLNDFVKIEASVLNGWKIELPMKFEYVNLPREIKLIGYEAPADKVKKAIDSFNNFVSKISGKHNQALLDIIVHTVLKLNDMAIISSDVHDFNGVVVCETTNDTVKNFIYSMLMIIRILINPLVSKHKKKGDDFWGVLKNFVKINAVNDTELGSKYFTIFKAINDFKGNYILHYMDYDNNMINRISLSIIYLNPLFLCLKYDETKI